MTIEQNSSDLQQVLDTDQQTEWHGSGYGGGGGPAEGPLWWHEGGYLLFSDIHNNRQDEVDARRRGLSPPATHQSRQWADTRPERQVDRL